MKKFLKYTFALAAMTLSLSACTNEQDDVFGGSAADRLNEMTAETARILASKPNGWVLQMFTTEREPGYTFLCDFSSNGSVKIAGNHKWIGGNYQEEVSLYQMIADNGPGLSFSSYNQILHILADPEDIADTNLNEQGYGHKGDYEFILMDVTEDRILLKGKKWGQKAIMTPMSADTDWQQYLTDLKAEQSALFSPRIPQFELVTPQGVYTITHPDFGYFYVVAPGGDMIAETDYVPFVVSPSAVTLWKPYTGKDEEISVENFAIADDGLLRCTDEGAEDVYIKAPDVAKLLTSSFDVMTLVEDSRGNNNPSMASSVATFTVDLTSFTGEIAVAYQAMYDQINKGNASLRRGQRIRNIALAYNVTGESLSVVIETQNYRGGGIYLDAIVTENGLEISDKADGTGNCFGFYRDFSAVKDFIKTLCGSVKFVSSNALTVGTVDVTLANGDTFTMSI